MIVINLIMMLLKMGKVQINKYNRILLVLIFLVALVACEYNASTPSPNDGENAFPTLEAVQDPLEGLSSYATQTAQAQSGESGGPPEDELQPTEAPKLTLTPTPTPDINSILAEEIKRLRPGMMAFNPPSNMKQDKIERVELRIAPIGIPGTVPSEPTMTAAANTLTEGFVGTGEAEVEKLKVGTTMKAKLIGDGFEIIPLHIDEEQIVADGTYTSWAWVVRPTEFGELELNLIISVMVNVEDLGEKSFSIPVLSRTVDVQVDPVYMTATFVEDNWQWLWVVIVWPAIGWAFAYFSKKRVKKEKKKEESHQYFE